MDTSTTYTRLPTWEPDDGLRFCLEYRPQDNDITPTTYGRKSNQIKLKITRQYENSWVF